MGVNAHGTVVGDYGDSDRHRRVPVARGRGRHDARHARARHRLAPDGGQRRHRSRGDRRHRARSSGVQHAYQLNLGPCRVCVTDVQLEERDLPGSTWKGVGGDGTVEGNRVRVLAQVANHDDQPHVFQVKARDETRKQNLDGQPPTVSLDPGEEEWVELNWDTDGLAWKDGAPDADHILRVRAVLGHTIFGGRSTVLKVRPRPVVLVPGALEDASVWKSYAELMHRANPEWEARPVAGLDTGSWSNLGRTLGDDGAACRGAGRDRRRRARRRGRRARRRRRARPRRADRPPVRPGPHGRGRRRPPRRAAPGAARDAEPRHAVRGGDRHRRRGTTCAAT